MKADEAGESPIEGEHLQTVPGSESAVHYWQCLWSTYPPCRRLGPFALALM